MIFSQMLRLSAPYLLCFTLFFGIEVLAQDSESIDRVKLNRLIERTVLVIQTQEVKLILAEERYNALRAKCRAGSCIPDWLISSDTKKARVFGEVFQESFRVLNGLVFPYPDGRMNHLRGLERIEVELERWSNEYDHLATFKWRQAQDPIFSSWSRAFKDLGSALYNYWFESEKLRDHLEILGTLRRLIVEPSGNSTIYAACAQGLGRIYRGRVTRLKSAAELQREAEERERWLRDEEDDRFNE